MTLERVDIEQCEDPLQIILHRARYDFVLSKLRPNQNVLEIGVGAGTFTKELFPHCGGYVGVEYDEAACHEAQIKNRGGAKIVQADARKLPFGNGEFSFIICLEVLEHLMDWQAGVREIHRCISTDGVAIISVPWRLIGGKGETNEHHPYEPGEGELVSLFERSFEKVEVYYQYFEETRWMTLSRMLHIRKFVGLAKIYADLSAGLPQVLSKLHISQKPKGMKQTLLLVATGKKTLF